MSRVGGRLLSRALQSSAPNRQQLPCLVSRRFFHPSATRMKAPDPDPAVIEAEQGGLLIRGFRVKQNLQEPIGEVNRYPEVYESVYEQDPEPDAGPNDEPFGYWGVDVDVPWLPDRMVFTLFGGAFAVVGCIFGLAVLSDPKPTAVKRQIHE